MTSFKTNAKARLDTKNTLAEITLCISIQLECIYVSSDTMLKQWRFSVTLSIRE